MLKSMTAYGRSSLLISQGRLTIEIQSINRKYLELQVFLPKEFSRFDSSIRKWLGEALYRGQVTARIDFRWEGSLKSKIIPNFPLINEYLNAFKEIKEHFHLEGDVSLVSLLEQPDTLLVQDEEIGEEFIKALEEATSLALKELLQMKTFEGKHLEKDLLGRISSMELTLKKIESKAPVIKSHYEKKLKQLLEELIPGGAHEERILRELCLFAEKVDIEEEITRFSSHLSQMKALIGEERETSGKTLEFLVQELQREGNTMGAKASDVEVGKFVLELKGEIERIREQIQNVE